MSRNTRSRSVDQGRHTPQTPAPTSRPISPASLTPDSPEHKHTNTATYTEPTPATMVASASTVYAATTTHSHTQPSAAAPAVTSSQVPPIASPALSDRARIAELEHELNLLRLQLARDMSMRDTPVVSSSIPLMPSIGSHTQPQVSDLPRRIQDVCYDPAERHDSPSPHHPTYTSTRECPSSLHTLYCHSSHSHR